MKLHVALTKSDNKYLNYPAHGILHVIEMGTNNTIISAVFSPDSLDGYRGWVDVRNPEFTYARSAT